MRLLVVAVLALLALAGCGSSDQPPGPWSWHELNDGLWQACTPDGDRLYGAPGTHGNVGLAVVPGGCRP